MTLHGNPIRVFIAEDHPIVRRGIAGLVGTTEDMVVVGQADNGQDAVTGVLSLNPDVVVMDLMMPGMDGIEATRHITRERANTAVLVLTSFATDDKIFPAIKAGALGYLIKDSSPDELVEAIRSVHRGKISLHPSIARKVLREISMQQRAEERGETLSTRELDVLRLVARGLSNQEIADKLTLSLPTIYTHVSNILTKLHLASRTQAALYALRAGYASLDDLSDT